MKLNVKMIIIAFVLAAACFLVLKTCHGPKTKYRIIKIGQEEKKKKPLPQPMAIKGKIAIVIDDWGYTKKNLTARKEINEPLTMAILPNLPESSFILDEAKKNGYEYILHLPLESKANKAAEKDTIYCSMPDQEIKNKLHQALKKISGAKGVNNHQGSRATENKRVMACIMSELKRSGLFFLDSVTTDDSICKNAAKEAGVKIIERDVFLDTPAIKMDDKGLTDYVKQKLIELSNIAIKRGYAVGIGHDKKVTLSVLKEVMPKLEKKGIKFVFVRELAE